MRAIHDFIVIGAGSGGCVAAGRVADERSAFEVVEAEIRPVGLAGPHPLAKAFGAVFATEGGDVPSPERESAGPVTYNMYDGRRWSAADHRSQTMEAA